jgi:hypothetical protein
MLGTMLHLQIRQPEFLSIMQLALRLPILGWQHLQERMSFRLLQEQ